MNQFFNENLSIIRNNDPLLYNNIVNIEDSGSVNIVTSKNGDTIPEVLLNNRKIYIHSRFDPVKEAQRFIYDVEADRYDIFILLGFGFAYHVEELLRKADMGSSVLVLEKNTWMVKEAIKHRDISSVLNDNRVKILVDPDEEQMSEALIGKSTHKVLFLTHRGSFQVDPEYYSNIRRIIKSYLSTKEVNIATLSKFEKRWSANIARNIKLLTCYPGANIFYDNFKGMPAIIASAGPSLNNSIEFIRKNQDKAIIIAVDTSYKILIKNGIEPHFCVSVDPQVVNARYFEGDIKGKTILIADPTVHPSVFHLFKGNTAITGMAFQMMKWIEEITGERGELAFGGSVSTNAYDFAKRIGASPVVLVGQDLAFTSNMAHARGSYLDDQVYLRINRFYNELMLNRSQLNALPKIYIKGIDGERVYTNQKMMIFLSWFEKRNDPSLINATFNGAYIKGINHINTSEIEFENPKCDIFSRINNIYNSSVISTTERCSIIKELLIKCESIHSELKTLLPVLERASSHSAEMITLLRSGNRDQAKLDYILNKLNKADNYIKSLDGLKDMIGFTIQRVIHTITEGYNIDENDESIPEEELIAKRSNFLYRGFLEGTEFNIRIINKMINLLSVG
ncbi:MAG: 6-hydroxymethylpterin diphosphokinase MptE-like protein [Spirochaetota bacterium]|nr:6-hydroxymethylpterin diphosphokinase MptE-like protein [Spirochaetota bacterium]